MTPKLFSELGLSPEVLKAIDKLGFEQAAPIQAEAIPALLQGRDVVGQSQTGSGKTAAFGIPAIEKVDPQQRHVQVLILCPTRELAVQVSEEIHKLALFKRGITALPIYGGQSYERQFWGLKQGAQIVIGTPGRVMDHMRRGTLRLETIKMVILDEVDVMLNMGFREDIELILKDTPAERQTVFFSATIPRPIQDLIQRYVRNPQNVRIEQKALTVPTIEQSYYEIDRRFKIELLTRLIDIHDLKLGIIFCNTKRMVDDLVDHLNAQGYSADRLHGDMSQGLRDRVMNKFRKSGLEFLVATDVAARGIDVDDVQVVFNYDLPYDPEDYVHRIGRTGRAGKSGRAISFVSGRELFQIQLIERFTKMKIQRAKVPTASEVDEARASVFLNKLRATLQEGKFKSQEHLLARLLEEGFSSTDIASALIHQLQVGEETAPPRGHQEESYARPERPPLRDHREPREPHFRNREPRPPRFDEEERPMNRRFAEHRPETPRFPADAPRPQFTAAPRPAITPRLPITPSRPKNPNEAASPFSKNKKPTWSDPATTQPAAKPSAPSTSPANVPSKPIRPPKAAVPPVTEQTRLWISAGENIGVNSNDVVNAIMGETGLPAETVGKVDIRERHMFVDVASEHVRSIISKLNRGQIKGQKIKAKVA